MRKISILALVVLFLAWTHILFAQENSRVGTAAAQFLKVGVGARAAALGECGTAIPGITGLYWNPAAVASVERLSVFFTNSSMYAGLSHNFFGFAYPLGGGQTIGLGVVYMTSDDIEITTVDNPEGLGTYYSLNDYAISLTYSRYVTDRLSLGVNAKFIHEGFHRNKATALAVDFGSMLDTGLLGLKLAMSLSNFGGGMEMTGPDLRISHANYPNTTSSPDKNADLTAGSYNLPMVFRIGIYTDLVGMSGQFASSQMSRLTIFGDVNDSNDALIRSNFGLEYMWNNILALRGGYRGFVLSQDEWDTYNTSSYSFGAGLHYNLMGTEIAFDYAYTDFQILGNTHQFSLMLAF